MIHLWKVLQSPGLQMADVSSFACRSFAASQLTFCSYQVASCICLMSATASLSLSILTLLPRDVQLILPISLRHFLENRHHYSTKRTSDTSDTRSLLKSLSSTNIPSIAKFRWVRAVESTAPGLRCQICQIWSKKTWPSWEIKQHSDWF